MPEKNPAKEVAQELDFEFEELESRIAPSMLPACNGCNGCNQPGCATCA